MFKKLKYRLMVLSKLRPYSKGVQRFFLLGFLLSIASMTLGFLNPQFYKMFIEEVILQGQTSKMVIVIIGYISILFATILLGYIKNYANNFVVNRVTFRAKLKIWRGLFKQDFCNYENMSIGDVKMRLDDDIKYMELFSGYQTIDYAINFISIIVALILIFVIQWQLALFSVGLIPITFYIDHVISKKERILTEGNRENSQEQSTWLHTSVQGWREVKALNLQRHEDYRLVKFIHYLGNYFTKWNNYWVTRALVIPKIRDEFLMQFLLYFIGGFLITKGNLTIGSLLVFAQYYGILSNAVVSVSQTDANLQNGRPASDRFLTEICKAEEKNNRKKIIPSDCNSIKFVEVSFTYPNCDNQVIDRLSFDISKGERVAITGRSGSGKTTILKLITGMIKPTEGKVLFSGVDVEDVNLNIMYKRIGFVLQENMLFNTTILENLLYAKNNASSDEIDKACKKAFIYDYIMQLPEQYETVIGERGIKLSGGQHQRIVLARMFLRDVDIFIFDEATSSLDQYSESIIHDAINEIGIDKTIIVVAHRQSSVELCDRRIEIV